MKKIVITLGLVLLVGLVLFLGYVVIPTKFDLKKGDITVEYKGKYKEEGYTVSRFGKDYTNKVKIKGKVNTNKVGVYNITYYVKIDGINFRKIRKVRVTDSKKPVITLKGDKKTYVCPKKEYKEEGYIAKDNYDGNITKKVRVNKSKEKIIYRVKDSSGNETKVVRTLTYKDKTSPEITFKNGDSLNITVGEEYKESGVKSIDNCDGDLTKKVQISGSVDTTKAGIYEVIYKSVDKSKNETIKKRSINVFDYATTEGIPGTIYLTFDDGPNQGTTNVILDILKEEGVEATFFVTNNGPDDLIKREYDEGHTVALHTATHNYSIVYASDESFYNDLTSVQDRVKRITGETSMIFRFPGGSSNTVSRKYSPGIMTRLTESSVAKGYRYYDWNISSGDAGGTTEASGVYNNVIRSLKKEKANMILMHDIKTYTRDALQNIIKFGKENGYTFKKITMDTYMIKQKVNN